MGAWKTVLATVATAALLLAAAGCDGEDAGGGDGATATPTAGIQPTPIPLSPQLPAGAKPLGEGMKRFEVRPGQTVELDTVEAAKDAGLAPPACAGFVFAIHWNFDGPGAQGGRAESVLQGSAAELGTGTQGRATVGCALLRFTVPDVAWLDVAFVVGTIQ